MLTTLYNDSRMCFFYRFNSCDKRVHSALIKVKHANTLKAIMVNMVNIIPAKHLHVSIVIVSIVVSCFLLDEMENVFLLSCM